MKKIFLISLVILLSFSTAHAQKSDTLSRKDMDTNLSITVQKETVARKILSTAQQIGRTYNDCKGELEGLAKIKPCIQQFRDTLQEIQNMIEAYIQICQKPATTSSKSENFKTSFPNGASAYFSCNEVTKVKTETSALLTRTNDLLSNLNDDRYTPWTKLVDNWLDVMIEVYTSK